MTILPSGAIAKDWPLFVMLGSIVTLPAPPKDASSEPSVRWRETTIQPSCRPATTILPSGCNATDSYSSLPPRSVVTMPPVPNDVSSDPSAR